MCFPVLYAGFFAKSQTMFFLTSSFVFCPPLKNDGRGELRFDGTVNDFLYKKRKCLNRKPSPLVGEGGGGAVGRGKCEQIRKNGNKCGRNEKSGCHRTILNILTCVRQLAPIASQGSALPSVFGGSKRLRKKEFIVLK